MLKKCPCINLRPCIKYTCLKLIQERSNKIIKSNTFLEFKKRTFKTKTLDSSYQHYLFRINCLGESEFNS
jgi:hypothetical protein